MLTLHTILVAILTRDRRVTQGDGRRWMAVDGRGRTTDGGRAHEDGDHFETDGSKVKTDDWRRALRNGLHQHRSLISHLISDIHIK